MLLYREYYRVWHQLSVAISLWVDIFLKQPLPFEFLSRWKHRWSSHTLSGKWKGAKKRHQIKKMEMCLLPYSSQSSSTPHPKTEVGRLTLPILMRRAYDRLGSFLGLGDLLIFLDWILSWSFLKMVKSWSLFISLVCFSNRVALASSTPKHGRDPPFLDTSLVSGWGCLRCLDAHWKLLRSWRVFKLVPGEGWMSRWKLGSIVSRSFIAYL